MNEPISGQTRVKVGGDTSEVTLDELVASIIPEPRIGETPEAVVDLRTRDCRRYQAQHRALMRLAYFGLGPKHFSPEAWYAVMSAADRAAKFHDQIIEQQRAASKGATP